MKHLILVTALFISAVAVRAQGDIEVLRTFIEKSYNRFELPSISVAVVKDGETVLVQGFGKRSSTVKISPDGNTLYGIASLSKAFTTAAIGMLVDDGKLKWNDKVVKHLPWFAMHDPYVTANMTVEDLLCHRSGLITFDGDLLWYGTDYSREDVIKRIRHREPTYGFRTQFGYQNIMFMTAGEVIEAVSGMSWDEFIQKRILNPLGMTRTTSHFETFMTDLNTAKPFINGEEIFMLSYDNSGATAALNSSVNDMSKWMNFWLAQGIAEGDTLLSEASINRIWNLHTTLPTGNFDEQNGTHFKGYGLGWFLMDYQGKKVVHHGGGLPGYISKVALVPEDNIGIVVLTNDMSSVPTMLMYALIDWAAGKDISEWETRFLEFKERGAERQAKQEADRLETKKEAPATLPLENYLGLYRDQMYGDARVSMGESGLVISLLPSKELFTGKMTPWNNHAFRFDHNDPFLPFGVATFKVADERAESFTIELPNNDFHFDKLLFEKVEE